MYGFNGNSRDNGLSNNRNEVQEVLKKSAGMNSMMRMTDGDRSRWIGHMNSIIAGVASSRKLLVKREREQQTREREESTNAAKDGWVMWQVHMRSLQKNRRITVTSIGYYGMAQRCKSNKNSKPPTMAMEKYMHKKITSLKQQHPPCTPGTNKRSNMGFEKAIWINNPI